MKKTISILMTFLFLALNSNNIFAFNFDIKGKDISVHGVLSQGYLKSDSNNFLADTEDGSFQFNEYGLNAYMDVTDRISIAAQLLGRDFGDFGNNDLTLDWAYINYYINNLFSLKVGKINIVYGLHNETRNIDMLRKSVLLPQSVYNESWRDTQSAIEGISLTGSFFTEYLGTFSYTASYCKEINVDEDSGISEYINSELSINIHDYELSERTKNFAFKWDTPLEGLLFNITYSEWSQKGLAKVDQSSSMWRYYSMLLSSQIGMQVNIEDFSHDLDLESTVYSAQYLYNNFTFTFEYCIIELTKNRYAVRNILPTEIELLNKEQDLIGFYFAIDYVFTESLSGAIIYSEYYPDDSDKDGKDMAALGKPASNAWLKDLTFCGRYDFNSNWTFKAECHIMDGTAIMNTQDNINDAGQIEVDDDWMLFTAKATYNF